MTCENHLHESQNLLGQVQREISELNNYAQFLMEKIQQLSTSANAAIELEMPEDNHVSNHR